MHYYEDWRGTNWTCKNCRWHGLRELLNEGEAFTSRRSATLNHDCRN